MEHTAERYTDCFEIFLREPNEATYTQVCAERYRRKQSGQSVDRREERSRFFQLLHAYQRELLSVCNCFCLCHSYQKRTNQTRTISNTNGIQIIQCDICIL